MASSTALERPPHWDCTQWLGLSPEDARRYWDLAGGDAATVDVLLQAAGYERKRPAPAPHEIAQSGRHARMEACKHRPHQSRQWWPAQALTATAPRGPPATAVVVAAPPAPASPCVPAVHSPHDGWTRPPDAADWPQDDDSGAAFWLGAGNTPVVATCPLGVAPGAPAPLHSAPHPSPAGATGRAEDDELEHLMGAMDLGKGPAVAAAHATATPPMHTPAPELPTSGTATPTAAVVAAATSPILSAHQPLVPTAAQALPAHLTAMVGRRLAGSAPVVAPPPLVLAPPLVAPSLLATSPPSQASPLVSAPLVAAPLVAAPLVGAPLTGPLAALVNVAPAPLAAAGDGDSDVPLVSRRRGPPPGVTPATPPLVSAGAGAPVACPPSPLALPVAAPAPLPALSLTPALPLAPLPPPATALPGILFAAVFLTPASREVLLCLVPPCHSQHRADHMTLAFRPTLDQLLALPLGAAVVLRILGQCRDARTQVCAADPPPWLPPTTSAATHITLSLAPGVPAREAGLLLSRVMERAATGAAPDQGGQGSYEHFPDPLELTGFVGIEMEDGSRLFSLHELASRCGIALAATQVERYEATHCARLREGGGTLPAGMLKAPYGSTAERNAPIAVSTAGPVPLVAPPLPLSSQPLPLVTAGASAPPAASPPASPGGGLGDFWGAVEGPTARSPTSPVVTAPAAPATAPLSPLQLPAAAPLGSSRRNSVDGAGSGSGSSPPSTPSGSAAGDNGPVVYRSAVRVGDWALVTPLDAEESTDGAGRRVMVMRQGWVKDVLLDDAYQEQGVLVLLHDNTIGRVQSVCDPHAAQLEHLLSGDSPAAPGTASAPAAAGSTQGPDAAQPLAAARPSPQRLDSKVVLVPLPGSPAAAAADGDAASIAAAAPLVAGQRKPAGASNHASEEQQLLRLLSGANSANLNAATAAAGGGAGGRAAAAAASARDDLALWREFEQLRGQFGQAACDAALEECGCDFAAAIEEIRARAAAGKLPAAGGASAAVVDGWASPDSRGSGHGGASTPVHAAGDASPGHVRTVAALAEAFGVPEAAALRLCASLPHVPPAAAVKALAAANGDANAAAAALLLSENPSPAKAPAAAQGASPPRSPKSARDVQQAALRALCAPDPADVVSLRRLAEVFPSVPQGLAAEVLKQHSGNYEAAARTLADGLAAEANGARVPATTYEAPSEADQLAMLRAMGILSDEPAPTAGAAVGSLGRAPASPRRDAGLADPNGWGCPGGGAGWGPRPVRRSRCGAAAGGPHHYALYNYQQQQAAAASSPPRAAPLVVPRAPEPLVSEEELAAMTREELEAKIAELRTRADVHFQAGRIFMHAAQEAVHKYGPCPEYETQLRRSKDEANAGKRVMAEVDRLALRLSNQDKRNLWTIDLHGASARAAVEEVARVVGQIRAIAGSGGVTVRVVTGKGKHSKDGVPVVKAAVLKHLEETGQPHELEPGNEGVVWIHVSQGEGGGGSGRFAN